MSETKDTDPEKMGPATPMHYIRQFLSQIYQFINGPQHAEENDLLVNNALDRILEMPYSLNESVRILSEDDCVIKIMRTLNSKPSPNGNREELPGNVFLKTYTQFLKLKTDEKRREAVMNFLLDILESSYLHPTNIKPNRKVGQPLVPDLKLPSPDERQEDPRYFMSGGQRMGPEATDNLKEVLSERLAGTYAHSQQQQQKEQDQQQQKQQQQENGTSYSYDPNLSSAGLGQDQMPNYTEDLQSEKYVDESLDMVTNALFSFTGIQGKYLRKDVITGRFKLDTTNIQLLTTGDAGLMLRLSELGYYHDRVTEYADPSKGYSALGCMGQALTCFLRKELGDYHGEVSLLHDQVNAFKKAQRKSSFSPREAEWQDGQQEQVTLFKLLAWYIKPLHRMQWLTKIAHACMMKKGGELISVVWEFLYDGNPAVDKLANDLLAAMCRPLARMISQWMLEGNITDIHSEFFVEALTDVGPDRLWHDKFRLRIPMLPKFICQELADKILRTGKSINFLREVCEKNDLVNDQGELKKIMESNAGDIFSYTQDTKWHAAIEVCYQTTSKSVLDYMVGPHKLLDHLQCMRRYLLLGQGDFVSVFIEHMKDELEKPGTEIFAHDLSAMLDSSLRCTNAQYDDPEILNHLDVVAQKPLMGDKGWDIVSLQYVVQGPLATMLEPTMCTYKALFKPLWRIKHMEFVLSTKIWKEQMTNGKKLRKMSAEISRASYRLHLFTSEIMHFIHQMQYYVLFEVIECNWVTLQGHMYHATGLDEILNAHESFLDDITVGCFINSTTDKERHLETVFENIIALEIWQASFYKECFKEQSAREELERKIAESEREGRFGLTTEEKMERDQERKMFEQKVIIACRGLEGISCSYEKAVSGFMMGLNSSDDPQLQLFGTRLDFNEFYKKRDKNLSKPLTFEHLRMSNVYNSNKNNAIGSRFVINSQASSSSSPAM
ncbi:gamma-tubulin complex component 3 [Drosophila guanche]|uniref:Blast:Gamma-tubulin complex component 3 homolog n=1 Tax=Drosophila guanche TaxID=7266 RepID=A0A3B0JDA5_DROGU|nr:gamma-tubulin complex component 3 [Drosophila guanche]SPP78092.1 blast:Gamma-tubulin complex component 3 homolog [Drosophila guanche]